MNDLFSEIGFELQIDLGLGADSEPITFGTEDSNVGEELVNEIKDLINTENYKDDLIYPEGTYIYSPNGPLVIRFDKPVYFEYMWIRKHQKGVLSNTVKKHEKNKTA